MKDYCYIKYKDRGTNKKMQLPLEKMVSMLLALEMGIILHMEALKAQAIVIRTNLIRNSNSLMDYNIKSIESYRDIWGEKYDSNVRRIERAVNETEGILILFKGKPIDAKYHLVCGGSTENSENVMENRVTYLRRVLCDYCIKSPYWINEKEFKLEELEEILDIKFPYIDKDYETEIQGFVEKIEKDECGRIKTISIGGKVFSGRDMLKALNLNSSRFNIYPTGIRFITSGMGHGLGLCQWGSNVMAKKGYDFMEILKYYYTGVDIKKMTLPSIKKPLIGKIIMIDPGHGGEDWGHEGSQWGSLEKDIVLKISIQLKGHLEDLGAGVYLTRDGDLNIPINARVEKANRLVPDVFISLHMDYFPRSNIKGLEIFYFGKDLESKELGESILRSLKDKNIPLRGVKEGNFYIFRGVKTNSLLIELGYLSSREEEGRFKDEGYVKSLVNAIKDGIVKYFI